MNFKKSVIALTILITQYTIMTFIHLTGRFFRIYYRKRNYTTKTEGLRPTKRQIL